MKPSRPFILRGLYEWLLECELTPYLAVNAEWPDVVVPTQFVEDGQIVLNINPSAVMGFQISDEAVFFNARFGGVPMDVYVPLGAVLAIYARENGAGMGFGMEPAAELYLDKLSVVDGDDVAEVEVKSEEPDKPERKGPVLRVVK